MANTVTEVSVKAPNRAGQLAAITGALGKAKVNITTLAASASGGTGVIRLVFADKDRARAVRAIRAAGFRVPASGIRKVVAVSLANKPGTLARATARVAKAGVNVDAVYMLGQTRKRTVAVLGVGKNVAKARRAL